MKYPCTGCAQEHMGGGCDDKHCNRWRQWFRQRWSYTRGLWRGLDHGR